MSYDANTRVWDTRRADKARRLARTAAFASGKIIPTEKATEVLEALLEPGDKVILEGDNQKQADFLSRSLARVDAEHVHDLHLLISTFSRPEHLDLFDDGIARRTDFAYAGAQSTRVAQLLADGKIQGVSLRRRNQIRGKRLFSVDSVREFLRSQMEAAK